MNRGQVFGIVALVVTVGIGTALGAFGVARGSTGSASATSLAGTWVTTVNLDSAPPGVPLTMMTLNTFTPDGAVIETPPPTTRRSPVGHGQWVSAGDQLFTATFTFYTYDAQGKQTGTQKVTRAIRLSEDRQSYRATARNEQFDTAGKVIFSGTATETGQRLTIGAPPPAP